VNDKETPAAETPDELTPEVKDEDLGPIRIETTGETKRKVTITVPARQTTVYVSNAIRKLAREVSVPGFRKGKAPRGRLEAVLGEGALIEQAREDLIRAETSSALADADLNPLTMDLDDAPDFIEGEDFTFSVNIEISPDVPDIQWKDWKLEYEKSLVDRERIERYMERLAMNAGDPQTIDGRPLETGDSGFFHIKVREVETDRLLSQDHITPVIGWNDFLPGFDEQVIGMATGESREFELEVGAEEEKTKRKIQVELFRIERREPIEINDETAADKFGVADLAELKEHLWLSLEDQLRRENEDKKRRKLTDMLIDAVETMPVPESMVEDRYDNLKREMERDLKTNANMEWDEYMEKLGDKGVEELEERMKTDSARAARLEYAQQKIADTESITVQPREANRAFEGFAQMNRLEIKDIKRLSGDEEFISGFMSGILKNKVMLHLVDEVPESPTNPEEELISSEALKKQYVREPEKPEEEFEAPVEALADEPEAPAEEPSEPEQPAE